jgi:hypothetical protein
VEAAATPDTLVTPSALADHAARVELARKGARLESDRGGRSVGEVVHAVLAVIPADRPDLVDDFVRYFGRRRRLTDTLMARAAVAVRSALAGGALRPRAGAEGRWHEVPFAVTAEDGVIEGAIDLLSVVGGVVSITDFKTDAAPPQMQEQMEALYGPQLEAYARVVRRATGANAVVRIARLV